jgi:ferric-dicitrate binding protein FerR (iron transport regulator)
MPEPLTPAYFLDQESFRNWALGANETDCAYWDQWIQEHPVQAPVAHLAAALVAGIKHNAPMLTAQEIDVEWYKLKARMAEHPLSQPAPMGNQIWMSQWSRFAVAASIIIAVGLLAAWMVFLPQTMEYTTDFGVKKNILLADGTEINLNSNSKLKTKSSWRFAPAREIWLEGEAYFKVVAHPKDESLKKFVVHTPGLDVNVVGTAFNVNARNNKTRVFLSEGKVRVTLTEPVDVNTLDMEPGDFVTYAPKAKPTEKIKLKQEPTYINAWKAGFYEFNKTPLSEVFELVESTHDVKIILSDSKYLQEPLSGKVSTTNLNGLFNSIANLYNLEYTRKGDQIYLEASKQVPDQQKP